MQLFRLIFLSIILSASMWLAGCCGEDDVNSQISLPNGAVGVYYFLDLGSCENIHLKSGSIPPGLNFTIQGYLTGTPTTAGTYTFKVWWKCYVTCEDIDFDSESSYDTTYTVSWTVNHDCTVKIN